MSTITYRPLLFVLLLSACASGSSAGPDTAAIDLRVEFRATAGGDINAATLQCGSTESGTGFLATRAHAACQAVSANMSLLTDPPPTDRACTLIFGGPETAHVTGSLGTRRVDRTYTRVDGCAISDWDKLKLLLDPRQ
jgi:hypothetical protein